MEQINLYHALIKRLDQKSTILITIISILMGAFPFMNMPDITKILFYSFMSLSLMLSMLIVAPWFFGKNNRFIGNIYNDWNGVKGNKGEKEEDEFRISLSKIVKYKSILFYLVEIIMFLGVVTSVITGGIYG